VQHAFGDFWGYVNAQVNLINSIASQAILITLFSDYLKYDLEFGGVIMFFPRFLIV
jgi:hypothetical protein